MLTDVLCLTTATAARLGVNRFQHQEHPWVAEFLAGQVESLLFEEARAQAGDSTAAAGRIYMARVRALLRGLRSEDNRHIRANLLNGRLCPDGLLKIEAAGDLLPDAQRKRLELLRAQAAEQAAREARASQAASKPSLFSLSLQCPDCEVWGAYYERIPHVGGHHKLGKTAGLAGTDGAKVACACTACGLRWKTEEPP